MPVHAPLPAVADPQTLAAVTARPELLLAQIDAMQAELDNLRQQADARRYHLEQLDRELRIAARLQRDFLPKTLPNHARVKFNRLYRPAGHVSGDLYDVRRLDEHHAGVYLADAVGHGMPAALLAMFMHNALQTKRIDGEGYRLYDSHEAVGLLNRTLCAQGLSAATFATAAYAKVNLESGEIDLSRAGHPLPLLIRAGGDVEEVGGEGALLGVMADELFEPRRLTLGAGDKLVLYTDGVEMIYVDDGQVGSLDAWRAAVAARRGLSADDLLADVWAHLETRGALADDITVVTLEMT